MSATGINKITIDKITYTIVDTSKLEKPVVAGTVGQVLSLTENGTAWITIGNSGYIQGEGVIIDNNTLTLNWDIVAKKDDIIQYSAGNNIEITSDSKINWIDTDYTAFEVMPTKVAIATGARSDVIKELDDNGNPVYYVYSSDIPAGTVHKLVIRSLNAPENCDVVVDWGDNTIDIIKDITWDTANNAIMDADAKTEISYSPGSSYTLTHDYASSMSSDKERFIVKIYGRDYWAARHNASSGKNLMSRIMDTDLPIASHINNLASFAIYSNRLLKVAISRDLSVLSNVINWSNCFAYGTNIQSITGFGDLSIRNDANITQMFNACNKLQVTDFVLPSGSNEYVGVFKSCSLLQGDVNDFLPVNGFQSSHITINALFAGCENITLNETSAEIVAAKMWNASNIQWVIKTTDGRNLPFSVCTKAEAMIPTSWGGTASDDLIKKDYIYFEIPDETQINEGQYLLLDIDFSNYDDFSSPVSFTQADCQLFNPSNGTWIVVPSDGIDLAVASSYLRMPYLSTTYTNCRYRWKTTDGNFGSYNTVII